MRFRAERDGLSVHAIAGTEVVLFGMDLPPDLAKRLLGFGFERLDEATGSWKPLCGLKTFKGHEPDGYAVGDRVSTLDHPVQAFLWNDYEVEPDHDYTYRVVAFSGKPGRMITMAEVLIPVQTEGPYRGKHGVWFNRGTTASQAYAHDFQNRHPQDVPKAEAYVWLSRGLEEAILAFIGRAEAGDQLRAAVYELRHESVLMAFKNAAANGVDVKIVFDAKRKDGGPREGNLKAIEKVGIEPLVIPRESDTAAIAHNKFIVHLRKGTGSDGHQPVAVWTGSTNLTEGGIFGHSNVGHLVRDPAVAARYQAYWTKLQEDPGRETLQTWNDAEPLPTGKPPDGITTVFSPRTPDDEGSVRNSLAWYAQLMDAAQQGVFLTASFGIRSPLDELFKQDVEHLRYVLLNLPGDTFELLNRSEDNVFVVGSVITDDAWGWDIETTSGLNNHFATYIHTKILLIDPLTDDPIVITGSANFSDASSDKNDENMLVIRGNTRVADIYLSEFMRVFKHFESRAYANAYRPSDPNRQTAVGETPAAWEESMGDAPGAGMPTDREPATRRGRHLIPSTWWALWLYYDHEDWARTRERKLFR